MGFWPYEEAAVAVANLLDSVVEWWDQTPEERRQARLARQLARVNAARERLEKAIEKNERDRE